MSRAKRMEKKIIEDKTKQDKAREKTRQHGHNDTARKVKIIRVIDCLASCLLFCMHLLLFFLIFSLIFLSLFVSGEIAKV